jgi:hypothetical protein
MKTWYLATIRDNILENYLCITDIQKYAGKKVYVYKFSDTQHSYQGRLFNNIDYQAYSWNDECFSEVERL